MERVLEPELMEERDQALAYANADFEVPHSRVVELFVEAFGADVGGEILDLGCGPGDITFRFASRFCGANITGVDGSEVMIALAEARKVREGLVGGRTCFVRGLLPGVGIPESGYEAIVSNALLHHLHRPEVLWDTVRQYSRPGTRIQVVDLFRPETQAQAQELVDQYAACEPPVLRRDFYNSLLAAFDPLEVEAQLRHAGLTELAVKVISDRHLMVYGQKE